MRYALTFSSLSLIEILTVRHYVLSNLLLYVLHIHLQRYFNRLTITVYQSSKSLDKFNSFHLNTSTIERHVLLHILLY